MSERYGTLDELPEVLAGLEDWARKEMVNLLTVIRFGPVDSLYEKGRLLALRDVLDHLGVGN